MKKNQTLPTWFTPQIGHMLVFLLAMVAIKWRFWPWMPEVFFGDDLSNLLAYKDGHFASSAGQAISSAFSEKYRPVFSWVMWVLLGSFEERILPYLALNVFLQGLSATLVFAIAHRLSRGSWMVALAVTLAVATSRFALYQVTQVTGLVEGIALIFFLGMIYCVARAVENNESTWRWSWLAVISAFLAMHTHERYIGIAVWLCVAFVWLSPAHVLPRARRAALLSSCVAILVFNVLYKVVVLGMPFFKGTGGTEINVNTSRVFEQLLQAALSIFGFNEGPDYLVGARTISLNWYPALPLAAVFILALLIPMVIGVRAILGSASSESGPSSQALRWPLLLFALGALLIAPPILTIRLEQRWLLEPFILLLFLFAWSTGLQSDHPRVPAWLLALVVGPVSIAIDSNIAPHFDRIFFVSSGRFATAAKHDIVDKDFRQSLPVGLLARKDHCNWTLLKGDFFLLYGGLRRTVFCFDTVEESLAAGLPRNIKIYSVNTSPLHLTDVTADWQASNQTRNEKVSFDFLKSFSYGHINNTAKVSSPSGQGVMVIPWDTMLGRRNALTVISGFSYRYDAVPIGRDAHLRFGISMIYPSREPTRAIVHVNEDSKASHVLYSQDLKPPIGNEKLHFAPITIPLEGYSGKNISVTFSVETQPGKDNSGHWVGFTEPRIVAVDQAAYK